MFEANNEQPQYCAEICRTNPTCFVFLVDQSGSMGKPFGQATDATQRSKAAGLSDAINRLLNSLVIRCTKGADILDRYYVSVIGYGQQTGPALGGELAGKVIVPISDIARNPLRIENRVRKVDDGAGGLVDQKVKFPVWFEPKFSGKTPMCAALEQAWLVVNDFLMQWPECYPPMVINITDGEATDGDPTKAAELIGSLASTDGPVLMFNLHLSSREERPILFPDNDSRLPDSFSRRLFRISSPMPIPMICAAQEQFDVQPGARGFVFNADLVSVIGFLNIGTRPDWRVPLS